MSPFIMNDRVLITPRTLRGFALYNSKMTDAQHIVFFKTYAAVSLHKLKSRLTRDLSKFDHLDTAILRKLLQKIVKYSDQLNKSQFRTIYDYVNAYLPKTINRGINMDRRTLRRSNACHDFCDLIDEEDEFFAESSPEDDFKTITARLIEDVEAMSIIANTCATSTTKPKRVTFSDDIFEAQALFSINHDVNFPFLTDLFSQLGQAASPHRRKTIEKIGVNLTAMFMCESAQACHVALLNIVMEFISVADVVSALFKSIDFEYLFQLFSRAVKFLRNPDMFKAQSQDFIEPMNEDMFKSLFRIMATMYAFICDEKSASKPFGGLDWQKNLFSIYRNTNTMPEMMDFLIYFTKSVLEFVQINILGVDPNYDATIQHLDIAYSAWRDELFELEAMYMDKENGVTRQSETRRRILSHYNVGQKLNSVVEAHKTITRGSYQHFLGLFAKSAKMAEMARNNSQNDKFRVPPYMLQICGPSGIGKSSVLDRLAFLLNQQEALPFEEGNLLFSRQQASPFWEGYKAQLVAVWDDLFQMKETTDRARIADELIRVCNSVPLSLNMAAVESKGNIMFASKYVVTTTNVYEERSIGIAHPDALWRRHQSRWKFNVPKKYRGDRGPNWILMQKDYPEIDSTELMYHCMECVLVSNDQTERTLSFAEFCQYIIQDSKRHFSRGYIALEANRRFITKSMEAQGEINVELDNSTYPVSVTATDPITKRTRKIKVTTNIKDKIVAQSGSFDDKPDFLLDFDDIHNVFGPDVDPYDLIINEIEYSPSWSELIFEGVTSLINSHSQSWTDLFLNATVRPLRNYTRGVSELVEFSGIKSLLASKTLTMNQKIIMDVVSISIKAMAFYFGIKTTQFLMNWANPPIYQAESNEFKERKFRTVRVIKKRGSGKGTYEVTNGTDDVDYRAEGAAWSSDYLQKIKINMCSIELSLKFDDDLDSTFRDKQHITFITGSVGLVTAHFVYNMNDCIKSQSYATLITPTLRKTICLKDMRWLTPSVDSGLDMALIDFQDSAIQRPSIIERFLTEADLNRARLESCTFMKFQPDTNCKATYVEKSIEGAKLEQSSPPYSQGENEYQIENILRYPLRTVPGDCGSLVIHNDRSRTSAILGIHVAGKSKSDDGFAQVVTRETLCDMLNSLGVTTERIKFPEMQSLTEDDAEKFRAYSQIDVIGSVSPLMSTSMPTVSKITPSLVHGVFQKPTHMPAMLKKTNGISPVNVAFAKADIVEGSYDTSLLKECEKHMIYYRNTLNTHNYARTLTDFETVNGFKGVNHLRPINIATSPGYPYVKTRKGAGKSDWFKAVSHNGDDHILMTNEIHDEMVNDISLISQGKIPCYPFVSCLKDEKRPIEKAQLGKTRLFSSGNQMHLLICRKFYGGYNAFLTANSGKLSSKVGIAANGPDFDVFYQYMTKGRSVLESKNNWNDGDFGSFDDSIMATLIRSFFESAMAWYEFHGSEEPNFEHDQRVRKNLIQTFMGPPHIIGNLVYSLTKANCSGNFATVHINGHVNELVHRYTFTKLGMADEFDNRDFDKYVNFATYGDDSLSCIGTEVVTFFNGATIGPVLKTDFGMTYTTANKTTEAVAVRSRDEVDFCKRKFHYLPEVRKVVGIMPITGLLETTNWIKKSVDDRDSTIANVESAHRELFLHGKTIYEQYSDIFAAGCAKNGCTYIPLSFRKMQQAFYKNDI